MPNRSALISAIALTASLVAFAAVPAGVNAAAPSTGHVASQLPPHASPVEAAALRTGACKITCKIGSFCLPLC